MAGELHLHTPDKLIKKECMQKIILFFCLIASFALTPSFAEEVPAESEGQSENIDQSVDNASTDESQVIRVGGLNEEQLNQLAIASEVREHEVVWLEVNYPGQEESTKVLALEQRPRSPLSQAQGAVLILHDKEQHADWPYLIRPLRMVLPDSGWYTLTVNLPYDEVRDIPKRELGAKQVDELVMTSELKKSLQEANAQKRLPPENTAEGKTGEVNGDGETPDDQGPESEPETEQATEGEEDKSVDIDLAEKDKPVLPYRERAQLHLKAAMDHIKTKGYRNIIVIGYRSGADIMLDYIKPLATQIGKQGFGLVMIDPRLQLGYQTDLASALGQGFRAPVLDVVNGSDLDSRVDAAEREAGARIASASLYRQIRLTTNESGAFQQTLIRRVRSWLEKYAPGMQAKQFSNTR